MLRLIFTFSCVFAITPLFAQAKMIDNSKDNQIVRYYNNDYFVIEGTGIPEADKESPYDRLPKSYKGKVRKPVWNLSKSSAGITARFLSNSNIIKVRWEVLENLTMNHMAETGIKGIDLYLKDGGNWRYVNTARPQGKISDVLLINNMPGKMREYKLFLPLYDGVVSLEVGIDSLSQIVKPQRRKGKPIIFYGTSITQGGCASRPGMVHTSIISRKLNVECINLGFSGNGKMEKPIAEVIAGIDALFYVIDCVPNMDSAEIHQNAIPLLEIIRSKRPTTPVVFVERMIPEKAILDEVARNNSYGKNKALRIEFEKMLQKGFTNIYYINNQGGLGSDGEATVDGSHYTDLGFMRFADFLISKFKQFNL
ncbi:MAG: hydrolase [Chlorobi bacterium]|nr:hydrolase [Chlorobiota bacterium]